VSQDCAHNKRGGLKAASLCLECARDGDLARHDIANGLLAGAVVGVKKYCD